MSTGIVSFFSTTLSSQGLAVDSEMRFRSFHHAVIDEPMAFAISSFRNCRHLRYDEINFNEMQTYV